MMNKNKTTNPIKPVLSEEILLEIGFEKLPHFTIQNAFIYKLGRNRHLSIGNVGTPNEILYICETDENNYKKITDLVCLHNYDYDGYLSKSKLKTLINSIGTSNKLYKFNE